MYHSRKLFGPIKIVFNRIWSSLHTFISDTLINKYFVSPGFNCLFSNNYNLCYCCYLHYEKSAVVKGSILIINSLNSHSIIISLRSIRKVKTKSVLGMSMTKINYSLDGNKNIIRFIGRSHTLPVKPDVLLNNAIKRVKKKGKS